MQFKYKDIIRRLRRSYALTQKELSHLLGLSSKHSVQRLENGKKKLSIPLLYRLLHIFRTTPEVITKEEYQAATLHVAQAIRALAISLEGKTDQRSKRKIELFEAVLSDLTVKEHQRDL